MASITRAGEQDSQLISRIGGITIVESHGHSAPKEVVEKYIREKFNFDSIQKDLGDPQNIYHLINHDNNSRLLKNYVELRTPRRQNEKCNPVGKIVLTQGVPQSEIGT